MLNPQTIYSPKGRQRNILPVDRRVFNFIVDHKLTHGGDSPTMREIKAGSDMHSVSHVSTVLDKLEDFGYIQLQRNGGNLNVLIPDLQITYEGERL